MERRIETRLSKIKKRVMTSDFAHKASLSLMTASALGLSSLMIADHIHHMITYNNQKAGSDICTERFVIPTDTGDLARLLDKKGLMLGLEEDNCPVRVIENPPFF